MFERYTEKARRVIFFARYEASQYGARCIDTEHLLLGLLREDSAIAKRLSRPPFTIEFIRARIKEETPDGGKISTSVDMPLTQASKSILAYAAEAAERLSDQHIGTCHLLLGLLREKEGLAARLLAEVGLDTPEFREEIGRLSDTTWKFGQPQKGRLEDYIEIHGELWGASSIREMSQYYWRFHWEKRRWVPRDALAQRSDKKLQLHIGQTFDPEKFELVKGGWSEDHCAICWWKLFETEAPEHREGYTNGQDWLCTECYERFVSPKSPPNRW